MTTDELRELADQCGIDAVGVAVAEPYANTESHIRERRERGLFGRLKFTTLKPEVSCHPELLVPGAKSVVAGALAFAGTEPERPEAFGRLPRYTWGDAYADLRCRLEELGAALGGSYRVLVDENDHVDREAAVRAGIGFYGKNTMVIAPGLGSWIVLGVVVTTVELEPTPAIAPGCGSCTACVDACPTDALDEVGVLDATKCLSYWTQVPEPIPASYRAPLAAQVYGCDICQDVCPWNRGPEKRSANSTPAVGAHVDLVSWLEQREGLPAGMERLYVPRRDPRWLRRNALVAAGNTARPNTALAAAVQHHAHGDDPLLAEHAQWALAEIRKR
ncbi:unannotated protein [freshwater metagenome]|uniref:Unannotated protein n=1 Tax=freshwater metagenome TaxID=449393 RepID=A0A6J6PHL0_9ZZZZ